MKTIRLIIIFPFLLFSCESTVTVDYDTIKAKKVIIKGEDNTEYLLSVSSDSTGKPTLVVTENK